jgi:hypothetical protein
LFRLAGMAQKRGPRGVPARNPMTIGLILLNAR